MSDLRISRVNNAVAKVRSTDRLDTLEIVRISRSRWQETPAESGVYLLYGTTVDDSLRVYIGKSTKSLRDRIRRHHVNPDKNWFGLLFAVPLRAQWVEAIEAELIGEAREADIVKVITENKLSEERFRPTPEDEVWPQIEKIRDRLELVLGNDIFTLSDAPTSEVDPPISRSPLDKEAMKRFVESIPRGSWASYADVAEAGSNRRGAMAVGQWLLKEDVSNVWRVLNWTGEVNPSFRGTPPNPIGPEQVRERLEAEGVEFDAGRAQQEQRWTVQKWGGSTKNV